MIDHALDQDNVAQQVWFTGKKNPFMSGMQARHIYIRGHGLSGAGFILARRRSTYYKYTEVVSRLITSGLPKTFSGKLKCYHCHSAESIDPSGSADSHVFETRGVAFAQIVADELYARGYRNCTYYGYEGGIDAMPKDGTGGRHMFVRGFLVGSDGKSRNNAELGRVSDFRRQFTPRSVPTKRSMLGMLFGGM